MPAVILQKFLGEAPKIAPELLPDAAAQIASNLKLYSGDLIPYRIPKNIGSVGLNGVIKTIYPMRNPVDPTDLKWLAWLNDVNVTITTSLGDEEQRIYYTGDGVPKVTNYDLAVGATTPYPSDYYQLGLPLPISVPSTSTASFGAKTTSTYARDSGNTATVTTAIAHDLRSGQKVTVSGFTTTIGKAFNATNVEVSVLSSTSFSYYNVGSAVTATSDATGSVNLAGNTITRNYVYTWVTPWGEESIPSEPSTTIYVKEGQSITVGNLPNAKPGVPVKNFIQGIRLYRTITSNSGTEYFRLRTLWFPLNTVSASRASNTVTLKVNGHHNLLVGDKIKITGIAFGGVADPSFDVINVTVQSVVDDYTFTYIATGGTKVTTTTTAGTFYSDASEPTTTASRYYESTTFIDDFDPDGLSIVLNSAEYDAPDPNLKGLITAQNNILVGFVNNELCFSEPNKPWAWPFKYRLVFDSPIVAIAPVAGSIIVATESYPYLVSGTSPSNMSSARIDAPYPCVSKRSMTNIGYGVIYATYGGIALYNPSTGPDIVTKLVHDWDTWGSELNPSTIVGSFYAGKYFASHTAGSFIFEREDKIGGYFVQVPITYSAAYYDSKTNRFYYISDTSGTLTEWDVETQPLQTMEWKSKVVATKDYLNLGAARVIGDYAAPSADTDIIIAYNATVPAYNGNVWALVSELGTINGPIPLTFTDPDTSVTSNIFGTLNSYPVNGDPVTRNLRQVVGTYPVSFKLWANKELVCEVTVQDSEIFRLPSGYRTDRFEIGVSGSARIKAIHIGETPFGLRTA
jgi:hypothetical protein